MNQKDREEHRIILFLASYFTRFPKIGGVIGERYVGLYQTFSERFSSIYDFYYYDESGKRLYKFVDERYQKVRDCFLLTALFHLIRESTNRRNKLLVLTAYPVACITPTFLSTIIFLFIFKVLGRLQLILDVIDIPAYSQRERGKWKIMPFLIHEAICLKIATGIVVPTLWCREYFLRKSPKSQVEVVPMGGFHQLIKPEYRKGEKDFNVLYVGPVEKERGVDRLVKCIEKINVKYGNIHLILVTSHQPKIKLPERKWLKVYFHIPSYFDLINIVSKADIGIIPYPLNSYWDGAFVSKMCLYMVAGKGIISTNLRETKEKLLKWNCGLIAQNWQEMEDLIIKLAQTPELTLQLGKNAREAAEKEYNWQVRTNQLNEVITNLK